MNNFQVYYGAPFGKLEKDFKDFKMVYIAAYKEKGKTILKGFKDLEDLELYLKTINKRVDKDE